jgi:hypothetical protein
MSLGGSSTPSTQTVVQQQQLPQYQQDAAQQNIQEANAIAARPYVPYQGDQVAPLTSTQQAGIAQGTANATNPAITNNFATAENQTAQIGGQQLTPNAVSAWMSPYVEQALQPQLQDIQRQGAQTALGINSNATGAGAFGDARQGVELGENDRNTAQLLSNAEGAGYGNAFNSAVGAAQNAFGQNASVGLQSANQLGALTTQGEATGETAANDLLNYGGVQQNENQQSLTAAYNNFINQQQYPINMLNLQTSTTAGQPLQMTNSTTSPISTTAQNLGALSALFGLGGKATAVL